MAPLVRLAQLGLLSYAVAVGTWTLLGPAPLAERAAILDRAGPLARGGRLADPTAPVTVTVDGLAANIRAAGTIGAALSGLGLSVSAGDRLSSPAEASLRTGQRIAVTRGLPVTLVDGGRILATRAPRGTVAELLASAEVTLGPLDRVDPALDARLAAGELVRITRIAETELTLNEDVPFPVRYVVDAELERGRQVVLYPGALGRAVNSYLIRTVDGAEVERTLLESVELAPASEEVRRIGTRLPQPPADIEAIIREAAARQGADADQLLRVAWCESRFNPGAYNASGASGLFQFMPGTWGANSVRAGYAGTSPFDPIAAANVAAWMFAHGQAGQWTCR